MFRERNTGTHPNTHCCHAVLDVLFIYWICAQSRSHAFPPALSPTKHAASFSPAYECACHTPAHPGLLPAACRVLGYASLPTTFFFSHWVSFWVFSPLSFPLHLHAVPPSTSLLLLTPLAFPRSSLLFSGFLPLFMVPIPLLHFFLCPANSGLFIPFSDVPVLSWLWPCSADLHLSSHGPPHSPLHAQGPSSPHGKPQCTPWSPSWMLSFPGLWVPSTLPSTPPGNTWLGKVHMGHGDQPPPQTSLFQ